MSHLHPSSSPAEFFRLLISKPRRWLLPAVVVAALAWAYTLVKSDTWEASQALVVRDEAGDRLTRPGRFTHADEMKTSQETILELAISRGVLSKALTQVGPQDGTAASADWPNESDIEALQAKIKISPPKGAEFGKTEVFYLKVRDKSQQRAIALALAISQQLQSRFGELREAKAQSTIAELTKTAGMAKDDLAQATKAMSDLEQTVGPDLAELRMLSEFPSADSDLRRTVLDVERELRAIRATQTENEEFVKILQAAQIDPTNLLASPSVLLKSQPALGRLRDGLVDAQLRTGQALGTMSDEHPVAKGARASEQAIREQLHEEISVAIRGIEADLRVSATRIRSLEQQGAEILERLARMATVRAEYSNLVAAVKHRTETLKSVEHDLAEARASHAAARAASLISLIDSPDTGTRPVGPSRATIVAAGLLGGTLFGFGIVLLAVPVALPATGSIAAPAESKRFKPTAASNSIATALRYCSEQRGS